MARIKNNHTVLDSRSSNGTIRPNDIETPVKRGAGASACQRVFFGMELNGRKAVVIGMARSGKAAVKLLLEKGATVRAVDEKPMGEVQGIKVEPQTEAPF